MMDQTPLALPQYVFDVSDPSMVPGVNWLQGLQTNVSSLATTAKNITLQTVVSQTGSVSTGSTAFTIGSSIPTNTSGNQYMTASITPLSSSSTLIIEVLGVFATNVADFLSIGLFKTGTTNAIKTAVMGLTVANWQMTVGLCGVITSGSTSSQTFTVRAGTNSANTITFNGVAGSVVHGGVLTSGIIIREMAGL